MPRNARLFRFSRAAPYFGVPILPLAGHEALVTRLTTAARAGSLPGSLLLHGPPGVGKQRLALELARALLCAEADAPCGRCQACRFSAGLTHPDLHWYFPRPRPRDSDPSPAEVELEYAEAIAERVAAGGLYARPSGSEGIFVATVRALVTRAAVSPAFGHRKVFLVGDAERMVPQEGAEQAANALLKLLEEPPADTTIVLTSSEPGALLPTIRSRVVAVRVPSLPPAAVQAFLADDRVRAALAKARVGDGRPDEWLRLAGGAPGRLLQGGEAGDGLALARRLLEAAESGSRQRWLRASFSAGGTKARGAFADALEGLTVLLHARVREAVGRGDERRAVRLGRAIVHVEEAKERARGNVSPALTAAALSRRVSAAAR